MSQYLRFPRRRQTDLAYAQLRAAGNLRFKNYASDHTHDSSKEEGLTTAVILLSIAVGLFATAGIVIGGTALYNGCKTGTKHYWDMVHSKSNFGYELGHM